MQMKMLGGRNRGGNMEAMRNGRFVTTGRGRLRANTLVNGMRRSANAGTIVYWLAVILRPSGRGGAPSQVEFSS